MNYYASRQIEDTDDPSHHKWHYTCKNDGKIWPVGNCRNDCPGHDTQEAACEHQREYEIDRAMERIEKGGAGRTADAQYRCSVCNAWTQRFVYIGVGISGNVMLCDEHMNRAGLLASYSAPGEIWSS